MTNTYDKLTHNEKMLLNSELQNSGKNVVVAYVLWFFLGTLGVHNFYLGRNAHGVTQLLLTLIGYLLAFILVGFLFLFIVGVWLIVDLFSIHKVVEQNKEELREQRALIIISQREDAVE